MPLAVQCPSCSARHQVQDQLRGKNARYRCGQVLKIPAANGKTPASTSGPTGGAAAGTIGVQCPKCAKSHQAPASMAGQAVRCGCGAAFRLPGGAKAATGATAPAGSQAAAGSVPVQCPGCRKQHQAPVTMAGQMVRCGCGAAFQVPGGQAAPNPFSDQAADPFGSSAGDPLAGGFSSDPFGSEWDDFGGAGQAGAGAGHMPAAPFPGTPLPGTNPSGSGANWSAGQPYSPPGQASGKSKGKNKRPGRCPKCGSGNYKTPVFTWWGGLVGQHIISHVICQKCYTAFNSKTGGSNTPLIVGYHVVILVIVLVCVVMGAIAGN